LVVNVTIKNVGNETARNVTIYSIDTIKGILFTQEFLNFLEPNSSHEFPMKIFLVKPEAGLYNVHIVAKFGNQIAEDTVKVKVKSVVNFTLSIEGKGKYLYGENATFILSIDSTSNLLLYGEAYVKLFKNGKLMLETSYKPMIDSWGVWRREINLGKLPLGNYTLRFEAEFYGRKENVTYSFTVYRRNLTMDAYFRGGKIFVNVREEDFPVEGIKVWINGREFTTNSLGFVTLDVTEPGTYIIKADLDGIISEKIVEVERPIILASQINNTLRVKVLDSKGNPIKGITVVVQGSRDTLYSVTDENGIAEFNVEKIGVGAAEIKIESENYLPASTQVNVIASKPKKELITKTITETLTTTTTSTYVPLAPGKERSASDINFVLLVIGFLAVFGASSYLAFFRPIIVEESIDKYYFVKIKAPRLRGVKEFKYEKLANVKDAWASRGNVEIEDNKIIWRIDELGPGEEAILQFTLS